MNMKLRVQDDFNPGIVSALLEAINDAFDNLIWSILENTTVYVVGNKKDEIASEIISKLERLNMEKHLNFFKNDDNRSKEIVFSIDGDSGIDSLVAKVNVENGNGYKTVSIVHFIKRVMEILQERKLIGFYTRDEERVIVDRIMFDVPRRFASSEVVTLSRMKELPYYI